MNLLEGLKLYILSIPLIIILVGLGALYLHNNL